MSRINTNVSSLIGRNNLAKANADEQTALTRLSTGLRINSFADDPAGSIAASKLSNDITGTKTALSNTQTASGLISTATGALSQISKLLNDIRGLVTQSASSGGLSSDQIAANQLQVDASLSAIDRITSSTTFQGKKLLDGSLGFTSTSTSTDVSSLDIGQATFGTQTSVSLSLAVTTSAAKASITGLASTGVLAAAAVIEVTGNKGTQAFTFGTGTTAAQITNAINLSSDATGVTADSSGASVKFNSAEYGKDQVADIQLVSGTFTGSGTHATGTDIAGNVNGNAFTGKGLKASLNTGTVNLTATLTASFGTSTGSTAISITGGGAQFQLGSDVSASNQLRLGITSTSTVKLSGVVNNTSHQLYEIGSGNAIDLKTDATTAAQVVDQVLDKISTIQGRLGAIQSTTLKANTEALNDRLTSLTDSLSQIQDADFAQETANLTRAQILVQSGTSVLGIANNRPQQILSLIPRG